MQLHQLKLNHKKKRPKRIGRGGKHGFYSGRGAKGQKARAGRRFKPIIRELIKKYPKLRGYKFKTIQEKPATLNIGLLEKKFKTREKISPQILIEKRLIRRIKSEIPKIKILGEGELTKALIIEDCLVSKKAKEKIEKAGGEIK